MLPSKKSIRMIKAQPFCGWVNLYLKRCDEPRFIMFSIKVIEHKKYLVGRGHIQDGEFVSVVSREGEIITLLPSGKWSVSSLDKFISDNTTVLCGDCVKRFFKADSDRKALQIVLDKVWSYKTAQRIKKTRDNQLDENKMWQGIHKVPAKFISFCNEGYGYKVVFSTSNRKVGICSSCQQKIDFQNELVSKHEYKCPCCNKKVLAVSYKQLSARYKSKCFSLLDVFDGKLVVRHFDMSESIHTQVECEIVKSIKVSRDMHEYERNLFSKSGDSFKYYVKRYDYNTGVQYWCNNKPYQGNQLIWSLPNRYYCAEGIYTGNFANIGKQFPMYSDVLNSISHKLTDSTVGSYRLEELLLYRYDTILAEQLEKIGLYKLAIYVLSTAGNKWFRGKVECLEGGTSVKDFLRLNRRFVRFAVENDINHNLLSSMQHFNDVFRDRFEDFVAVYNYCSHQDTFGDISHEIDLIVDFCKDYGCTVRQVVSYLRKQKNGTITELKDYVEMYLEAYKLSYGTSYSVVKYNKSFLFPQHLMESHDAAQKWLESEKDKRLTKEIAEKNKMLLAFLEPFKNLDGKTIGEYSFSFPHKKSDFIRQGEQMHICVGRFSYFDEMCCGKSIICFVAKSDKPYATVEFKCSSDGQLTLAQARGKSNENVTTPCENTIKEFQKLLTQVCVKNNK